MWIWFVNDWRGLLPAPWNCLALALTAVVCGALVGSEREKHEKPAGLRTIIMVCLGSTLFTMVSYAFTTTTGDSGRIAAQIVTGIGFLGAGAILHGRANVTGMTTAATIWVTAAIGVTVGTGYAGGGLGASLLVRAVLTGILLWENHCIGEIRASVVELVVDRNQGKTRIQLEKILEDFHVRQPVEESAAASDGTVRVRLSFRLPRRHRIEFLDQLAALPEVQAIDEEPDAKQNANRS